MRGRRVARGRQRTLVNRPPPEPAPPAPDPTLSAGTPGCAAPDAVPLLDDLSDLVA